MGDYKGNKSTLLEEKGLRNNVVVAVIIIILFFHIKKMKTDA